MNKNISNKLVNLLGLAAILLSQAACGKIPETATATPRAQAATQVPTQTPTQAPPTETPTPTPLPIPERPDFTDTLKPYTGQQAVNIRAGIFAAQEQVLVNYYHYWMNADPAFRPFDPYSAGSQHNFIYVFNPDNPADACVAITAAGYAGTDLFSVPYRGGQPQPIPPGRYEAGQIITDQGPLPLTRSGISAETGQAYTLSCEAGRWVHRDPAGAVMERINSTGQWEVSPVWLANQYHLNPDRQYTLVTVTNEGEGPVRYLRDEYNQAYMLRYQVPQPGENPAEVERWVDTSLEEKYGHLVPPDWPLLVQLRPGNMLFDNSVSSSSTCLADARYQSLDIGVISTGNVKIMLEEVPGLEAGKLYHVVYGEGVYRDRNKQLQIVRGRFDVVDPDHETVNIYDCINRPDGLCSNHDWGFFIGDANQHRTGTDWTVNDISGWWGEPGRRLTLVITAEQPSAPPPLFTLSWFSNLLDLANWPLLQRDAAMLAALQKSLLSGSGVNPYPDYVWPLTAAAVHMDQEEYSAAYNR
jgi:hypothetical protein